MTRSRRGFTLGELMITVIIIGILATIAIPSFDRAVRRGRLRAAADVLRTIFAGEQTYSALNSTPTKPKVYIAENRTTNWLPIFMDNPNTNNPMGFTFIVTTPASPNNTTFLAAARFPAPAANLLTIDQDQNMTCASNLTPPVGGYTADDCPW